DRTGVQRRRILGGGLRSRGIVGVIPVQQHRGHYRRDQHDDRGDAADDGDQAALLGLLGPSFELPLQLALGGLTSLFVSRHCRCPPTLPVNVLETSVPAVPTEALFDPRRPGATLVVVLITGFAAGAAETNCYLVAPRRGGPAIVIDPGEDA